MAYVFCYGACFGCGRVFGFNPDLVPSIPINPTSGEVDPAGVKEPICSVCVDVANPQRTRNGLPAIVVAAGAYEPGPG
jgi:hypothetical protein